jgi:hypothetical protein
VKLLVESAEEHSDQISPLAEKLVQVQVQVEPVVEQLELELKLESELMPQQPLVVNTIVFLDISRRGRFCVCCHRH